jgi:hypothetical protein
MQRKFVVRSARPRWLAGASVIAGPLAGTLLVSACGSSSPAASSSASASAGTASAATSAPAPSVAPSTPSASAPAEPTPTAAVSPTMTINPGGTNAATQSCAYRAAHDAYIYITKVTSAASGALTITGQNAKLICGGPDDFHWNTVTATETVHTTPTVTVSVFPTSKMAPQPIKPSQLATYLKTDDDTKIFLIGGPLTAITSLQEQFHP